MSAATVASGAAQLLGGVCAAPLLPGLIQRAKAIMQGRPGPGIVQPYRELQRLWHKQRVAPQPRTFIYEVTPPLAAGATVAAVLLVPVANVAPPWPVGSDLVTLFGLLALPRFALALSAWDTGGAFGLMGAARDLAISVWAEALLLLSLVVLALGAGTTDLRAVSAATATSHIWTEPAHWAAALGLVLWVLVETGRQPIDNPDTHLELTMIHEGPLLEYAGPDLAYLQWSAAMRHWIVLVLATDLILPAPHAFALRLLETAIALPLWCVALAVIETFQAKMRLLRVPLLLGAGGTVCLLGLGSWLLGAHT